MDKLSIRELRDILPVGTQFTATFIGRVNTKHAKNLTQKREVVAFTRSEMRSEVMDGASKGEVAVLPFKDIELTMNGEGVIVTRVFSETDKEDFLKITDIGR